MSIADEIRAVLQEVGSEMTIRKPGGTLVTGEFLDDNSHTEHTNPMIGAFFFDLNLQAPTAAVVGDTLIWGSDPHQAEVILTAIAPQMFENEVVEYIASGYVVNAKGAFWKYDQDAVANEANKYDPVPAWVQLYPGVEIHGAVMDQMYRSMAKPAANESMDVSVIRLQLFISSYFTDIAMGMQWRSAVGGVVYKVDHIEDNNFIGIRSVFLTEDTRA